MNPTEVEFQSYLSYLKSTSCLKIDIIKGEQKKCFMDNILKIIRYIYRTIRAKNVNRFLLQFMVLSIKVRTIPDYGEQIIVDVQYMFKK